MPRRHHRKRKGVVRISNSPTGQTHTSLESAKRLVQRGRAMMDARGRLVLLDHAVAETIEHQARRNRQDAALDEAINTGLRLTAREARHLPIVEYDRLIGRGRNTGGRARR